MSKRSRNETRIPEITASDYMDLYNLLSDKSTLLSSYNSTSTLVSSSKSSSAQSSKASLTAFFSTEEMLEAKKRVESRSNGLSLEPTATKSSISCS